MSSKRRLVQLYDARLARKKAKKRKVEQWEGSMSREWLAKGNENENFFPSLFFSIKLHLLAGITSNHRALFIAQL